MREALTLLIWIHGALQVHRILIWPQLGLNSNGPFLNQLLRASAVIALKGLMNPRIRGQILGAEVGLKTGQTFGQNDRGFELGDG